MDVMLKRSDKRAKHAFLHLASGIPQPIVFHSAKLHLHNTTTIHIAKRLSKTSRDLNEYLNLGLHRIWEEQDEPELCWPAQCRRRKSVGRAATWASTHDRSYGETEA